MNAFLQFKQKIQHRFDFQKRRYRNNRLYNDFSRVNDYFSQRIFQPHLHEFIEALAPLINDESTVLNVGAGTGLFDELLLSFNSEMLLTVIEPCEEMIEVLEHRLDDDVERYLDFFESVPELPAQHNLIIFQRSFNDCLTHSTVNTFCQQLFDQARPDSLIAIQEPPRQLNIAATLHFFQEKCRLYNLNQDELNENWPIYQMSLAQLQQYLANGTQFDYDISEIHNALLAAGFTSHTKPLENSHYCIVQKNAEHT